jgi:HAD superfamily hydrolase (TIGR01484 family)
MAGVSQGMKALSEISAAELGGIRAVLTDIDDTLTTHGQLPALAFAALEQLKQAGFIVVPITGRPAGWCDMIARFWPVDAVVGENGAFYFRYDHQSKKMSRLYTQDKVTRDANHVRLHAIAADVLRKFPGTAIASDQAYREIDVAIDFCEDVSPLPLETAQSIAAHFHAEGAQAKVSSIHVNAWFGTHDKLSMSHRLLDDVFAIDAAQSISCVAYCGDSPNDAPMYGGFPIGIGVANIRPFLDMMDHRPTYITDEDGGGGFASFVKLLLAHQRNSAIT